ncbi:MAG: secretin N-terminal domain-containing protein, partial [Planctomycetota bacterium]
MTKRVTIRHSRFFFAVVGVAAFAAVLGWSVPVANAQEGPAPGKISFRFRDAPVTAVMEYLSQQTGWTFILDTKGDARSKASKVSLTAVEARPVDRKRAFALLNHALAPHDLHAVRFKETVIIMTREEARKRSFEIAVGSDPDEIEMGDNLITQIIPLQYTDANEIRKELQDELISDKAKLLVNKQSNSLIMQDTSTNVKRFVTLIHKLDQGVQSEVVIKPFTLQNADATEVARVIQEVFAEEDSQRNRPRGLMGMIQRFMGGRRRGSEETAKAGPGAKVKASVDPRTNTVVVKAAKDTMKLVEQLIEKMDLQPVEQETTFVYHLKNADAENVSTLLNNVLRSSGGRRSTGGRGQRAAWPFQMMFGGGRGRGGGGGGRGGGRRMQSIGGPDGPGGGPQDQLFGDVNVQPDTQSNSLLVRTNPKNFPLLKRLIDDLDMIRAQVLIKVFI